MLIFIAMGLVIVRGRCAEQPCPRASSGAGGRGPKKLQVKSVTPKKRPALWRDTQCLTHV